MKKTSYTNIFLQTWLHLLLIVLAALAVYFNTFQVPFVLDDIRQIADNYFIRSLDNFLDFEILKKNRAFTDLTFALNYYFGGLDVFGYHLVNLVIHIINGFLVYFLVLKVLARLRAFSSVEHISEAPDTYRFIAFFAALIFTVHPLQTQAVTYIVQRYTSMAATFYMLAVIVYIAARNKQLAGASVLRVSFLFFLSFISALLAFLCKQSAASLPLALLFVEFALFDRTWSGWKKKLLWTVPAFMLMVLFFFYNAGFFSGNRQLGTLLEDVSGLMRETKDISRWHYLLTQFNVIPKYLFQFVIPLGQNADPMRPVATSFWQGWTLAGFSFILLIFVSALLSLKKFPVVFFSVIWFLIAISIESSIIPIKDTMFEHRMYLPMVGPAFLLAWMVGAGMQKYPRPVLIFSMLCVFVFGFLTFQRNQLWQDETALWADSVSKNPDNYRAHTNLALALESKKQKNEAFYHYNKALRLNPDYAYAHLNLGAFLGEEGKFEEAEYHFLQAGKSMPDNPKIINNLGVAAAMQGNFHRALELFRQAAALDIYYIEGRINLAITLLKLKREYEAGQQLKAILKLDPDNSHARNLLQKIEKNTVFPLG